MKYLTEKEEKYGKALGIGLIIIVAGFVGVNQMTGYSPGLLSITSGGLCTSGVSDVAFFSNSEELAGEHFLVSAVGDCSDQVIRAGGGELPADQLVGTRNGEEVQAENSFIAQMSGYSAWADHPIYTTSNGVMDTRDTVYKVQVNAYEFDGSVDNTESKCTDTQSTGLESPYNQLQFMEWKGGVEGNSVLYCFSVDRQAEIGEFNLDTVSDYEATFEACSGSTCESAQLTKQQLRAGTTVGSGSQSFYVQSPGDLMGGVIDSGLSSVDARPVCGSDCQNPAEEVSWTLAREENIDIYKSNVRGFKDNALNAIQYDWGESRTNSEIMNDLRSYQSDVNEPAQQLVEYNLGSITQDIEDRLSWSGDVRIEEGNLRAYDTQNAAELFNPELIFRISADWVGIGANVAEPKIQDDYRVSMNDQTTQSVSIDVRNDGPTGSVFVGVDCQSTPLTGGGYEQEIREGGTVVYNIDITSDKIEELEETHSCAINAKDTDAGSTQDSSTLTVDIDSNFEDSDGDGVADPYDECPNTKGVESNNGCALYETDCSDGDDNDGDGYVDEDDPDCDDGEPEPEDRDNDGIPDKQDECPLEPAPDSEDGCPDEKPDEEICENTAEYPNGANEDNDGDGYLPNADPDCKDGGGIPDWFYPVLVLVVVLLGVGIAAILIFDDQYPRNRSARQAVRRRVPIRRSSRGGRR